MARVVSAALDRWRTPSNITAVSLSVPGVVDWDLRRLQTRVASCAGVVRQMRFKPNQTVARRDTVLTFESEMAIGAQERLIRALSAFETRCDFERGEEVRWARFELVRLKFTNKQIKRIEQTRRVLRQLPILSPWPGLLVTVARPGDTVAAGAVLFSVATVRAVLCAAPVEMPDEELLDLRIARVTGDGYDRVGQVRIDRDSLGERRVLFDFASPSVAPAAGLSVHVGLPPPPPPPPPPPLLRGIDYRLLKRIEDPSYPLFPQCAPGPLSPEDAQRNAQRLMMREKWRGSSIEVELPEARRQEAAAADLVFGDDAWRAQAIETTVVRDGVIAPTWRALGIVETIRPKNKRLHVRVPCDGWCEPGSVEAGQVLEPGALLVKIRPDEDATVWRPLAIEPGEQALHERDLVTVRAVRDELHVVMAQRCVVRVSPRRGRVAMGAALASLRAAPWPTLRCAVLADVAAALPARVRARIRSADTTMLVIEFTSALFRAPCPRRAGEVLIYIPLPERAEGWQAGVAYDVTLVDDAAARMALTAPADCVARLGRATEVLAHTGRGQLTRRTVTIRATQDGLVEIVEGLVAGDVLVRQLETRMRWFPRFQAAMVGVWTPRHQEAALLRSVDKG